MPTANVHRRSLPLVIRRIHRIVRHTAATIARKIFRYNRAPFAIAEAVFVARARSAVSSANSCCSLMARRIVSQACWLVGKKLFSERANAIEFAPRSRTLRAASRGQLRFHAFAVRRLFSQELRHTHGLAFPRASLEAGGELDSVEQAGVAQEPWLSARCGMDTRVSASVSTFLRGPLALGLAGVATRVHRHTRIYTEALDLSFRQPRSGHGRKRKRGGRAERRGVEPYRRAARCSAPLSNGADQAEAALSRDFGISVAARTARHRDSGVPKRPGLRRHCLLRKEQGQREHFGFFRRRARSGRRQGLLDCRPDHAGRVCGAGRCGSDGPGPADPGARFSMVDLGRRRSRSRHRMRMRGARLRPADFEQRGRIGLRARAHCACTETPTAFFAILLVVPAQRQLCAVIAGAVGLDGARLPLLARP